MKRSVLYWILAFVFTVGIAVFQRITGPTYPVDAILTVGPYDILAELPRSHGGAGNAEISFEIPDTSITGQIIYRRLNSNDPWMTRQMERSGDVLIGSIPHQPPAGNVVYTVQVSAAGDTAVSEQTVIRFKGAVPAGVLIPHILAMFLAMLFSTRTGIEALLKGNKTYVYTLWTIGFMFIGGVILGPVVQKYAFGAFWTGFPFGHDLTDNKTAIAFLMWLVAAWKLRKNRNAHGWALAASIILLAVYLIPHSVLGSELDYTSTDG